MDETAQDRAEHTHESPMGKVVGAVHAETVDTVTAALAAAGFPADHIDVMTAADIDALDGPINDDGLRGLIERFLLSLGDELNALEELRHMARNGHTLIGVPAEGDEAIHRAAKILRDNGAHEVEHFGRWKITSL